MSYTIFSLQRPMTSEIYRDVLACGLRFCSRLSLVKRDHHPEHSFALTKVFLQLNPFLIEKERTNSWPGTVIYDETAEVLTYRFDEQTIAVLISLRLGLFEWVAPAAPEDFSLLRNDGTPLFISITHEEDCYFKFTTAEIEVVKNKQPILFSSFIAES